MMCHVNTVSFYCSVYCAITLTKRVNVSFLLQVLKLVQDHGERHLEELPPYDVRTHEGFLKHLTIRSGR